MQFFIKLVILQCLVDGLVCKVSLVTVTSDTTTNVVVCPYSDPLAHGNSCLQDGLSSVQYNIVGRAPPGPMTQTSPSPHQKRGAPVEEIAVERGPDVPPPSTIDLSTDFVRYFCSDNGGRMVDCAIDVHDKCADHPSMDFFTFNPIQATRARKLCKEIQNDYGQVARCLNETSQTKAFLTCAYLAYDRYSNPRHQEPYVTASCRALAEAYNCYTTLGQRFCGQTTIDFAVTLMRAMEERHCSAVIDRIYVAPIRSTADSTSTSTTLQILVTLSLLLAL